MNVADFADFAGGPAIAWFATAEKLRRVADFLPPRPFSALFRKPSASAKARYYWLSAVSAVSATVLTVNCLPSVVSK